MLSSFKTHSNQDGVHSSICRQIDQWNRTEIAERLTHIASLIFNKTQRLFSGDNMVFLTNDVRKIRYPYIKKVKAKINNTNKTLIHSLYHIQKLTQIES